MVHSLWQTEEDRIKLLKKLVKHDSVTHSYGETIFVDMVKNELMKTDYFNDHESNIHFAYTIDGRRSLLAHYESEKSKNTIVLISHYDTVGVDDFSEYQGIAFDMDQITASFKKDDTYLNEDAKKDLNSDEYYFGRGSMDMKPGLMLHMSLIEKASIEKWDVNLILVTVPDEEVGSKGMLTAVKKLNEIRQQKNLEIKLHLNSEPTFQQEVNNDTHYVYTGTIGKLMPAALVYGKETHVGTPLNGLSSNYIMSFINRRIEYNHEFKEYYEGEETPLPVSLMMRDIKAHYDVQTPFRTIVLYNVFIFKQTARDIFNSFNVLVRDAVDECKETINNHLNQGIYEDNVNIQVLTYKELYQMALKEFGEDRLNKEIKDASIQHQDNHLKSIVSVDRIMSLMRHIGPTVITFFTPPYYPATNSSEDEFILNIVDTVINKSRELSRTTKKIHFFNGICDLSYVKYATSYESDSVFSENTPIFNKSYSIPFNDIREISAPILNCGPIGKDAHKVSERILKRSAFNELPILLETIVKDYFLE